MSELDVEKQILSAIMLNVNSCTIAFELLNPEHFINPKHQKLFAYMVEMHNKGETLDIVTLSEHSDQVDLIMEISTESVTTAHIKSHVNICLDRWFMLKGREKLIEAVKSLESKDRSVDDLRTRCEELAFFLSDRVTDKGLQHISNVCTSTIKGLVKMREGKFPGVQTGFKDLDDAGFQLRKKTMTVLAARPGMGKSALALKIAKNCKENVAVYSLEMANEEQYERLISMETGLSNDDMRSPAILEQKFKEIADSTVAINETKIWINDSPKVSIPTITNQCKRLKAQHGLGLLIVDYLGLIKTGGKYGSRREEVGSISKGLKQIGTELDIPILALGQLNRSCEDRSDKRPILADLRESGDIEQDAHMVMFLYRGEVYDEKEAPGVAEVLIRKNRSGRIGTEKLTYVKSTTNFKDYGGAGNVSYSDFAEPF